MNIQCIYVRRGVKIDSVSRSSCFGRSYFLHAIRSAITAIAELLVLFVMRFVTKRCILQQKCLNSEGTNRTRIASVTPSEELRVLAQQAGG